MKFWDKRYYLFSQFDQGILLDDESWFSVVPETVGKYTAERIERALGRTEVVMDGMCGCGGSLIQMGLKSSLAIGIELDEVKVGYCRNNASIYGLGEDRLRVVN